MKRIILNESQYKRLFEDYKRLGDDTDISSVPTSLDPSTTATMVDAAVTPEQGEPEFVDNDSETRAKKHLRGASGYKQDSMSKQYPFGFTNMARV